MPQKHNNGKLTHTEYWTTLSEKGYSQVCMIKENFPREYQYNRNIGESHKQGHIRQTRQNMHGQ